MFGIKPKQLGLKQFKRNCGGDMLGSYDGCQVMRLSENQALVSMVHSQWHHAITRAKEYVVDASLLTKLEELFHKHHLEKWHNKKFTQMFINDGASTSYSFLFDQGQEIHFSSQFYPDRFQQILVECSAYIQQYTTGQESLPALILPPDAIGAEDADVYDIYEPDDGVLRLMVYQYDSLRLSFRFLNGTDTAVDFSDDYRLCKGEEVILERHKDAPANPYMQAHSAYSNSISLKAPLTAGTYQLSAGGSYSCEFTIG